MIRALLTRLDPRVMPFLNRLTNQRAWASLDAALSLGVIFACMLAGLVVIPMDTALHAYSDVALLIVRVWIVVLAGLSLLILPPTLAVAAGQLARADIEGGQLNLLHLTNIPGRVVFQAYMIAALHRMRIPLILSLSSVPLLAMQFADLGLSGLRRATLLDWAAHLLLAGAIGLGVWGMNLVGAAVGVNYALRRHSAAVIALGAPTIIVLLIFFPLSAVWSLLGPLIGAPVASLRPAGIGLWVAVAAILGAAPYILAWTHFTAERRLL